jgi:GNAT superfamily N-acetyltransferase
MHEMSDLYPDRRFWLGNVFVAPEFRGRGIASALAMQIVEIARGQNANALHLQTTKLDGGLYGRLGWERIEQVHYRGYKALVMAKSLKGP